MKADHVWIQEQASAALAPARVARTLTRLAEAWSPEATPLREVIATFPLGAPALIHLLSVSSICATRLTQNPAHLLWLADRQIAAVPRSRGRMANDLRACAGQTVAAQNFRALRIWKGREMLRISLREIADVAPLEETTSELSQLAEICLTEVWKHWDAELRARRGAPTADFAVLGLGKLGGRELNHSSDIDVVFLYSEEGQVSPTLSYHEWFNRLGARIVETFAAVDPAGALFRIDLRLRPEGGAGPLARSLESMENYYAGFGETWERLALIKARGVCGSQELAYEFIRQHQPFIYPKSPTPDLLDEIATIKRRIERDIVGAEDLERDVKLGSGGIREIEFVVQALQLIHGARHAFLQDTSTLKVLSELAGLDLLPRGEALALDQAYRFLRRVEHRLQIEAEQQTHTIPSETEAHDLLARSLGFSGINEFSTTLRTHRQRVRSVFERIISEPADGVVVAQDDLSIFRDGKSAGKRLTELAQGPTAFHVAPRTRQVFRKLRPLLLQWLGRVADPDATLNQFVRFVEAYGLRSLLFELLVVNPRLLELLARTFDASRASGDLLIRHPQLLEEMTRGDVLNVALPTAEHLRRLGSRNLPAHQLDEVRAYRQKHTLRILLRDVLGLAEIESILMELSALAEATLIFVNQLLGAEDEVTIIAVGKFGGAEISYGADLDVLLVGENARAAQDLIGAMAQASADGSLATLDARLRPDGEKGPIIGPLESYRRYYEERAQLWELQALTRVRAVSGPLAPSLVALAQSTVREAGKRNDLFEQIGAMIARIRRERGSGTDFLDYKTGVGGMIEAEFLVQALQMRSALAQPRTTAAIAELAKTGVFFGRDAERLTESYLFLRRCESALGRVDHKSVPTLPADEFEESKLARRLGFESREALGFRLAECRKAIRQTAAHYLGATLEG
ncbi:MAG TPA: hypothetical protein VGQ82_06055 [Chthoniobacterales bacterium]|nr:hypothetical protein [Chthoniobacterales bacterium]